MTLTSLDNDILSALSLPYLKKKAPLISAFATDLSDQVADSGTGIKVSYTSQGSASLWSSTYDTGTALTATGVTVTLREPYFKTDTLTPNQVASYTQETLVSKIVGPQIESVLDEVMSQVYAIFTTSTVTNTVWSGSGDLFNFTASQAGAKFLDQSGSAAKVALLNANLDYALNNNLAETYGASAAIVGGNTDAGRKVGKLTVYPAYALPSKSIGVAGIVCSPDAVALATRIPSTSHPIQFVTKDSATGLSTLTTIHEDLTTGKVLITTKVSMGVTFGRPGMAAWYRDSANV
jgi:hypothetical protein